MDTCKINYIVNFKIADESGAIWLTAFEPHAMAIMQMSAEQLKMIKEMDTKLFNQTLQKVTHQDFIFTIRAIGKQNEFG